MTREDDRDYQRQEDRRREYREQDHRREQRKRDFWRDRDRQRDNDRDDATLEAKRRAEESARARQAMRSGHTSEVVRNIAGPDAAISYLQKSARPASSRSGGPRGPRTSAADELSWKATLDRSLFDPVAPISDVSVTKVSDLVKIVEVLSDATFRPGPVLASGDCVVDVRHKPFRVRLVLNASLLRELASLTDVSPAMAGLLQKLG